MVKGEQLHLLQRDVLFLQICPFWNLKETGKKLRNSVSNCSALLCCFALLCSAQAHFSSSSWLIKCQQNANSGLSLPYYCPRGCLAAGQEEQRWESPAQSWPRRRAAAPRHTCKLSSVLQANSSESIMFLQRCGDREQGKVFQTWNLWFEGRRYFSLMNTTVMWCFCC